MVNESMPEDLRVWLLDQLHASERELYVVDGPLALEGLFALLKLDRPDLKDPTLIPAGAGGPWLVLPGAILTTIAVLPFFSLPWALATGRGDLALLAGASVVIGVTQRWLLARDLFNVPAWSALLVPLSQLALCGISVHSALRHLNGRGPRWKGREYPTR